MSDDTPDIPGDLPAPDPQLAAWYAAQPGPVMPESVWRRLEAALAAEPPLTSAPATPAATAAEAAGTAGAAAALVDLSAQREQRRTRRLWPVLGAAAGLVLVGAVVLPVLRGGDPAPVVADGAPTGTAQPAESAPGDPVLDPPPPAASPGIDPGPGQTAPTATTSTPSEPSTAPEPTTSIDPMVVPATMVMSTGTQYTEGDLLGQLDGLLASAGYDAPETMASARISTSSASPTPLPGSGVTADLSALAACLQALRGGPLDLPALVVDRATYQGVDSAIVIMLRALSGESPGATSDTASPAPPKPSPSAAETLLDVYVVGADCTGDDVARAVRLTHRVN